MFKRIISTALVIALALSAFCAGAEAKAQRIGNLKIKKGVETTVDFTAPDGKKHTVTWKSLDTSIVTVRDKNVLVGKKTGEADIVTTYYDSEFSVHVIVGSGSKPVSLSVSKLTLTAGDKKTLKLKNASASKVKWSSSNKKVATVSGKGVVKAKKEGSATISAKYKGKKYKCKLTVLPNPVTLYTFGFFLELGEKRKLDTKGIDKAKIKWTVSGKKYITFKNGVVKGVKEGKAKITGTAGSTKLVYNITVDDPETTDI